MLGFGRAKALVRSPQTTGAVGVPAPNSGVNRIDGLSEMGPKDAIFMYNLIPSEFGTRVRTGYQEWCTSVGTGGVRTIIPFTGAATANDRLFGCAGSGIYDISASATAPAVILAFPVVDDTSGMGIWANFVNDNAAYFAMYTDESNGYYTYTAATTTWAKVAMGGGANQISGVDPALFCFVMLFKQRVWFIEKGTGNAWYLPTNAIYGAATKFNFGNKFKHGGTLVALYNWTVDGGEGVDDYLIAVGSGGDIVVYKGSDPSTATDWFQHGAWYIGPPPVGRRIAGSFAGELYILSSYGLLPMSKLMSGTLIQLDEVYLSRKITPLVNTEMLTTRSTYGWEVKLVPTENLIFVSTPKQASTSYIQFAYSLNTPGWSLYRDFPYFTGETWHGNFYFSDSTGRILIHSGNLDNVSMSGLTSNQISWSMLMSFQGYGQDANFKRAEFIRPVFLAEQIPGYLVEARYDYNLSETFGAPAAGVASGSVWDTAIWDLSVWGGEFQVIDTPQGAAGLGRVLSIGLSGNSGSKTILIKFDLMFNGGGLL